MLSNKKIAAIYDLREAVETKVLAEQALDHQPSAQTGAALLDATLELESKTQLAIDVCHECGDAHDSGGCAAPIMQSAGDNVISVDFAKPERSGNSA